MADMNEQAWKEQAARIIDPASWAVMDSYLKQMLRKYKGQNIGYDPEAFKHKESMAIAAALWPLVQQAIAAERGEVVALADAVDAWLAECTDGRVSPHTIKLLRSFSSWANQHTSPPTEAQIRADERERCAKVAEGWETEAAGDEYMTCGNGKFWDAGTAYDQGRADSAASIRARGD
jgi:predicted transcriptional regulator